MNAEASSSAPDSAKRVRRFLVWGLVPVILGLGLILGKDFFNSPEPVLPEVTQSELILTDDGLCQTGSEDLFNGFIVSYYPEGSLRSRSEVVEGRLHGLSEGWYPDGQMETREIFVHGVSDGVRVRWHANGERAVRAEIRNGQLHGLFQRWHENGQIAEVIHMVEGTPHGVSEAYFPSGSLQARVEMKEGKPVHQEFWKDGEAPLN